MNEQKVKALFVSPDGSTYPDYLICSGTMASILILGGKPCPYSQSGQMPDVKPLNPDDANYSIDKGKSGDFCPPCAKSAMANLGHWQGEKRKFPEELLPLRLFKCRMWFWLVVPGLREDEPQKINL